MEGEGQVGEGGPDIKPALVRILKTNSKQPKTAGTGWVVDLEQGLIVTADHIIASIEKNRKGKKADTVLSWTRPSTAAVAQNRAGCRILISSALQ